MAVIAVTPVVKRYGAYAALALGALLWIGALLLLSRSAENSEQFGKLHPWILLINAAGLLVLLVLLATKLAQLIGEYRRHVIGSRLKVRTLAAFGALGVAPLLIVYYFALTFLDRGIDSWFNVKVRQGLNDALTLSRGVLDVNRRDYLERTENLAQELARTPAEGILERLAAERRNGGATEITLFGLHGGIVATSTDQPVYAPVQRPPEEILLQVRQGRPYVSLEPVAGGGYFIRTAAPLPENRVGSEARAVIAIYPVAERLAQLADTVQRAHAQYGELSYQREPLKYSFRLTLTLVLLLSLLAAVYGAFFYAQRLVKPIQDLSAGTRAVGKGDFDTRLPLSTRDEMGFLVHSFNDMTRRLARAREEAQRSQEELLEAQRAAAWGEVARRLAHEIKNPLTPIQLSAERLRRRFLDGMAPEDAQVLDRATHTIVQQVEAMKEMVNAFSEYARAPTLNLAPLDLNLLIMEVTELYRAQDSRVQWIFELDTGLGVLRADRDRLRQILNNLLTNVMEALEGRPQPQIEIATRRVTPAGQSAVFAEMTVADNGAGFDPALVPKVFEPYVTSKPKGTGLGLAIVKKIVEEHGGRIEAENRRGGGARVRVLLPMTDDVEMDEQARTGLAPREGHKNETGKERA